MALSVGAGYRHHDEISLAVRQKLEASGLDIDMLPDNLRASMVMGSTAYKADPNRVGLHMQRKGLRAKYPVILVPGFVTSGLEMWASHDCFKSVLLDLCRARHWPM